MRIKGSNQYQSKWGLSHKTMASVWAVAFFTTVGIQFVQHKTTSPCPEDGCKVNVVYAKEAKSFDREVADYIMQVFEPEGLDVQIRALRCFSTEGVSHKNNEKHFDEKAYNYNSNGTWDYGIAQWNQVHGQKIEELQGYKKQIDLAYKLYKSRGFNPWYGKGCK